MIKTLLPGSFDPPTVGHLDIINRSSKMFDSVTILVAEHPEKKSMFSVERRIELLKEMISDFSNVSVDYYDGLVVEYAKRNNITVLVRGLRNVSDYNYESELEVANRLISSEIDTIFINARPELVSIKSSLVKELFRYSVDISTLVTYNVYQAMKMDNNYIDKKSKLS